MGIFSRTCTGTWTGVLSVSGLALTLVSASPLQGQRMGRRLQGAAAAQQTVVPPTTPAQTFGPPMGVAPAQPQSLNMLQQPAREAQVVFTGDRLSIQADNASLKAILHKIAADSGMKITGLGSDERVFGTFGPGSPRDVLADLLNGAAYNLVLVGDSSMGAPRELILTPEARSGAPASPSAPAQAASDDSAGNDQDTADGPSPPDVPPPAATSPANAPPAGVRTPQQLFEQLQRMRQAQQQQIPSPDQQQQQQ